MNLRFRREIWEAEHEEAKLGGENFIMSSVFCPVMCIWIV